eukprot:765878-Hanusia_phi.AAC.12
MQAQEQQPLAQTTAPMSCLPRSLAPLFSARARVCLSMCPGPTFAGTGLILLSYISPASVDGQDLNIVRLGQDLTCGATAGGVGSE